MKSGEIRQKFLKYFEERGHRVVKSSSLIPENDPTLLFTNAGMNQFKNVFLGLEKRDYRRAASSQKCVRAGGKHNDLENVGRTARHHTFFEMLGNFSFGDYFKKEAIEYAWDLVTREFGLPLDKLYVTIFQDDEEAFELWYKRMHVPSARIVRLGEKDNFWAMGDTGPCGPCSEIHYDLGVSPLSDHTDCAFPCECGRYVEIWNLVFMQFNRDASGTLTPLPSPSIDTGMGLERITAVLQGKLSNYDTDLFRPLIVVACDLSLKEYGVDSDDDVSLRIIADHSRAAAFLITDGVLPSNEGRGYVLRKILRRAIRHGRKIGLNDPFLYKMTGVVAELMKEAYPELIPAREYVARVVLNEEEKFSSTLTYGLRLLDELCDAARARQSTVIPGGELFKLYDTYGFPIDLAMEVAQERGLTVDEAGFNAELKKQRERSKLRSTLADAVSVTDQVKAESKFDWEHVRNKLSGRRSEFVGYKQLESFDSTVKAIVVNQGNERHNLRAGDVGEVVLDVTPFYAEAGGQVGDQGVIRNDQVLLQVLDAYSPVQGLIVHKVKVLQGELRVGDRVQAQVDEEKRRSTMRNHTGTHLLHAALRDVLGEHVKQAGSLVAPDRLRFDFSHFAPLSEREMEKIEDLVNQQIQLDKPVYTQVTDLDKALDSGALAFFGDKYAATNVRVVSVDGFSKELCGGTHVQHTGEIGLLKIVGESSISAGVRRIEAITGQKAIERLQQDENILSELTENLKVPRQELVSAVERMSSHLREALKEVEALKLQLAERASESLIDEVREIKGVKVLAHKVENIDRAGLRNLADRLKSRLKSGVVILGAPLEDKEAIGDRHESGGVPPARKEAIGDRHESGGVPPARKATLVVMVSADLTKRLDAGKLIKQIAPMIGGGGGGKPDLAEAGGKDASKLDMALQQSYQVVEKFLNSS